MEETTKPTISHDCPKEMRGKMWVNPADNKEYCCEECPKVNGAESCEFC
ncbi:MAG: hypothetical protein WEC83_01115 [Patescibacteria group bacterium]